MISKISTFKRKHKLIFALIIGLSVVSFWRGAWGIMDVYIFPNNYGISSIVCFFIGIGLLSATNYIVEELM
ncbi:hypothetical protein COU78_04755 [Candidatus Peregrinibacteria bacterium CG10_big_fil_rev_8_21_14_0_10_49_24]|nr:MAG: hypothetical protein COV83_03900 [Candidatus Peregrinibacteria bacterium CG11_big_fil_rev_8_21_14_0_20_49_14]PIR50661.1 MAG: hypothetical protein COU78_04755 [Candidatus Peregrinibacteria bacterium CG10_big_fil_rev_8_21_14_0_10_49_24]PJA67745.1 MAG: hypothetical protein CO157_03045 [Candidatus Peregrinibacteria bacterium CG_4_9_14_3_um_filter_49_12]